MKKEKELSKDIENKETFLKDEIEESPKKVVVSRHKKAPQGMAIPTKGEDLVIKEDLLTIEEENKPLTPILTSTSKSSAKIKKGKKHLVESPLAEQAEDFPVLSEGLNDEQVAQRVQRNQVNVNVVKRSKSYTRIILDNVLSIFNIALFAIFAWLLSVKAPARNYVFIVVLLFNITIGIVQEIKAKKKIESLTLLVSPTIEVLRNSTISEILTQDIVLDDLIILKSSHQIVADCLLKEGRLEVNESMITGESKLIVKNVGDQLFSGSYVVSGKATAKVLAVGKDSYINKLSSQARRYKKAKSSLYSSLRLVLTILSIIAFGLVVGLFFRMRALGTMDYAKIVTRSAGAAIGMLPAGLLLCTSVALALGVIKLSSRHTLVQEVFAIETLARVDTLCLDKTGTITDGTMSVVNTIDFKNDLKINVKSIMQAILNAQEEVNLTSKALIDKYGKGKKLKVLHSIPFSSERKYHAYQFDNGQSFYLGAPEIIIKNHYPSIKYDVERGALDGCRVLCLAYSTQALSEPVEANLIPLSLIFIEDTIRPDAIATIKYFEEIGVNIKVISGDNPMTVSRIAMKVGIKNAMNYLSLEGLSDKEVEDAANSYQVFGRVSPEQKRLLVKSLKKSGHTVAMTGDGINDILALREADTSIAMASGSDAARNISHIVLTDSNFSALPKVVSEGRRVINNIAKVATLFLTKTIFSIILTIIGIVKGDYPIEPSQLMLIEFFVIAIPSFFLALENNPNKVSGNFIYNIFKSAIPGALVISINSIFIYFISKYFGYGYLQGANYGAEYIKEATSTVIAITATFSSLVVLYRVCHPFNKLRGSIFATMCILCVVITLLVPNLLGNLPFWHFNSLSSLIPLGLIEILVFVIAVLLAPALMYLITNIGKWIKNGITFIFKKLSDISENDN